MSEKEQSLYPMKQVDRLAPSKRWLTAFICASALFGGTRSIAGALISGTIQSTSTGAVSIYGNHFLRDNQAWIAKGVTLLALVAPETSAPNLALDAARESFGSAELDRVRAFGADVIRFQISEPGLDKKSSIYSASYKDSIGRAVELARRSGFTVILSMQWQAPSGLRDLPGMPGDSADRAWREVLPLVANDAGVMLELFNEPTEKFPAEVTEWVRSFQLLIKSIRTQGAVNVLLIDGIGFARFLPPAGASLHDPILQLGYAIHPYIFGQYKTINKWEAAFGKFADSHAVIATEWNATSNLQFCQPDYPETALLLVRYLQHKKIGLVGWAFDFPDSIFRKTSGITTDFEGFSCRRGAGNGAGKLLKEAFEGTLF